MKKRITFISKILMALLISVSFFHIESNKVEAKSISGKIVTSMEVYNQNGEQPETYSQFSDVRVKMHWVLPNGEVKNGDTTLITLPPELRITDSGQFDIKAVTGEVIAVGVMNKEDKTVLIKFNTYAETLSNVRGDLWFTTMIDQSVVKNNGPIDLNVKIEDKFLTSTIVYKKWTENPDLLLQKSGVFNEDKNEITYSIKVNPAQSDLAQVVVTDELKTPGMSYKDGSFIVRKVNWEIDAVSGLWTSKWLSDTSFAPEFTADKQAFSIDLGDMNGFGYTIQYVVKLDHNALPGEQFRNNVNLLSNGAKIAEHKPIVQYNTGGGAGEGYLASIGIEKVNGSGLKLPGAKFDVYRTSTGRVEGTIETGADGKGKLDGLLIDDYYLVEIEAPDGYAIDSTPIHVLSATDFVLGVATKKVVNNPVEKTSVSGTKTWVDGNNQDGIRPNDLEVTLYADGNATTMVPAWTKAKNVWTYNFTNIAKFDNFGNLIDYTVEEVAVFGYDGEKVGNNFTNTHTPETITLGGTKTWVDGNDQDGIRPNDLEVTLSADGNETTMVPAWTKAGNVWTYSFNNLAKKAGGVDIKYTVAEESVTGYTGTRVGNDFTNTHTPETITLSGTKTWVDGNDQDGIRPNDLEVTLSADGNETTMVPTWTKAGNVWTYSFNNLAKKAGGVDIKYTVAEETVAGYTGTKVGNDFTNTHTPETITLSGTKTWVDGNDQDGIRPNDLEVTLSADGNETTMVPTWTKAGNVWTYSFNNLAKKAGGVDIKYTVAEETVAGYTGTKVGNDFTNTHTPETITLSGTKTWVDGNDQDGIRPNDLEVTLSADGNETTMVPTWTKAGNVWTYSFNNLAKKAGGVDIKYTVAEETVAGYTGTKVGNDFTNTHTPETITLSGTKTWVDGNDQDGIRPNDLEVTLSADGNETTMVPTWTKAGNVWTYSFANLAKKAGGVDIKYTVAEETVAGYTGTKVGNDFTNTHTPETITLSGTKTWVDGNDQDGIRPNDLEVTLSADGNETTMVPTWTKAGNVWTYSFNNLAKKAGGVDIKYTVAEETVAGYTGTKVGNDFTNTHTPETITLSGTKTWVDGNDQDGIRPNDLEVTLSADGNETTMVPTWTKAGNVWTYSFNNLAKKAGGVDIKYTVAEETVAGYTGTKVGNDFTNTHTPETITLSGTKTWVDGNDQDGIRPNDLEVTLSADGNETTMVPTWTKAGNVWTYSFNNLAKKAGGVDIKYTVAEETVAGYTGTKVGNDFTNTHTPETITLSGTKTWVDGNDQDGIRPNDLEVTLSADGNETTMVPTWTKAGNVWTYSFANLAKKAGGVDIKYTVEEETVAGYTGAKVGNDFTNTLISEMITVGGTKTWVDGDNRNGMRPANLEITLYADGSATTMIPTWVKTGNVWTYSFANLVKQTGGVDIVYTVEEEKVPRYTGTQDGFNFTNTYLPETIIKESTKAKPSAQVPTSDNTNLNSFIMLLLISGIVIVKKYSFLK